MNTPAFTPGPWIMDDSGGRSLRIMVSTPRGLRKSIAQVGGYGGTSRLHNARLIAATPEMYEALKEAREQVAILQDRLGITDSGHGTLSIINAALAKAAQP